MMRAKWSILLLFFWGSTVCFADTVVITFKSGKTQEVILQDRVEAIEAIQFRTDQKDIPRAAPQQNGDRSPKTGREKTSEEKNDKKAVRTKEQGIRFKWAEPKMGE